ncbi:MAG TPA: aminopeptidase [Methylibium sp.]|uniref:aminopeptidase n=1 Tax=Methylibium sp. TaxID=2067992 RepID=UPI002DBA1246|nr:aminopeptidase [Methylibium sp.]HEU4458926.1 aminopeptidase [Methylibium sp.]
MHRRAGLSVLLLFAACASGCASLAYYAQSIGGHLGVMGAARPVDAWLADASTPPELRARLELTQRMREFAIDELALPDNASYRRYADLGRSAVVWNVVAAPELSLQLKTWCFPVVGCVGYRGYFDRAEADAHAGELRAAGLEAAVYGVPAYSTLGKLPFDFFADPLLNTFIRYPEGELARMIFHELAHQVAYAEDDTSFNESFATAVERLGGSRWLATRASAAARDEYARFDARRQDFRRITLAARRQLEAIYAGTAGDAAKREAKAAVFDGLRAEHERLKQGPWQGYAGYDGWFARANNASLAMQGAYNDGVPAFEALFAREGADFARFYAEVRRLAALPRAERKATLDALAPLHATQP